MWATTGPSPTGGIMVMPHVRPHFFVMFVLRTCVSISAERPAPRQPTTSLVAS